MQLGPYAITGEVGRGGCGTVYRGRSPDGRDVAIKVLQAATPAAAARFERERALLAELGEAEGFVPLLGAGEAAEAGGAAYLVMPFVPGGTLRDRLRGGALPIDEALSIARRLAETLGRAHARGIVHRDLKPENVLFTAAGSPLVADLGLAKRLAGTQQDGLSLSMSGEFRGTAGYMAPEQMRDSKSAGPPADVFSLGAVLYECLAGKPLFLAENVLDVIDLANNGSFPPLETQREDAPRWLCAVVRRCLAREPARRYADGAALRAALGEVTAQGRAVTALAAGALGLIAGLAGGVLLGRSTASAPVTVAAPQDAVAPTPSRAPTTVTEAQAGTVTEVATAPPSVETATPLGRDLARAKLLALEALLGDPWAKHTGGVSSLVVGRDAILAGDGHGVVRLWRGDGSTMAVRTGGPSRLIKRLAAGQTTFVDVGSDDTVVHRALNRRPANLQHHAGAVHAVAATLDDRLVATGGQDGEAVVWDLAARGKVLVAMHESPVTAVALSEDGDALLTGTEGGVLSLWSVAGRRQVMKVSVTGGGAARCVALTPDRARGAIGLEGTTVVVVDLATNAPLPQANLEGAPLALGFAGPERLVGVDALGVSVWALPGMERVSRHAFPEQAYCAGIARDGGRVAFSPARGCAVLTLDVATGQRSEPRAGHLGWVADVVPAGDRLWSSSVDFTLRRWDAAGRDEVVQQGEAAFGAVTAAPDGSVVAAGATGFHAVGPSAPPRLDRTPPIGDLLFAGDRLWVGRANGMVEAHSTGPDRPQRVLLPGHVGRVLGLVALPERGVVSWAVDGEAALVRANHPGAALLTVTTRPGRRAALAALPGARATVVIGDKDGSLRWLDLERGAEVLAVPAHAGEVLSVAASPDGRWLVSGGFDRALRLWDARTAALLEELELRESLDLATTLTFTPDGRLLVGCGSGTIARLAVR